MILAIIGEIGAGGAIGHAVEFIGPAIDALSMEGRMTICNMAVEAGARTGIIAPDEKTFRYLEGRPKSPKGAAWDAALRYWETLRSDEMPNSRARCGSTPARSAARHLGHQSRAGDHGHGPRAAARRNRA